MGKIVGDLRGVQHNWVWRLTSLLLAGALLFLKMFLYISAAELRASYINKKLLVNLF